MSDHGDVYICKPASTLVTKWGYEKVAYRWKTTMFYTSVHRLVMLAFKGPCPKGKEVNHIDGNKSNNKLSNLEYVTKKENARNALDRNAYKRGQDHYRNKLTRNQAKEIRRGYKQGDKTMAELALIFNCSKATVSRIIRKEGPWA